MNQYVNQAQKYTQKAGCIIKIIASVEATGRSMWNIGNEKSRFKKEIQNVKC